MTICVVVDPHYHGNKLFDASDPSRNRDDCLRPWIRLKEVLESRGHQVHTDDLLPPDEADLRLYSEVPSIRPRKAKGSYLINLESPIVRRQGNDPEVRGWFEGVFGWAPGQPSDRGYRQIRIPFSGKPKTREGDGFDRGFLCLIAGNKASSAPGELYSERRRVIRWFERHRPNDFGLYGVGWDQGQAIVSGTVGKVLARLGVAWKRGFPSYQGAVASKAEVLTRYRFCLAFENVEGYPGYVTEKILDPMLAGCIPVYRGAPDILNHVPAGCFVDASRFHRPRDLADHLVALTAHDLEGYRTAIRTFLGGPLFGLFSPDHFAETVTQGLLKAAQIGEESNERSPVP